MIISVDKEKACDICNSKHIHDFLKYSFFKDFTYLFLEKGEGKEKERERNINL